MSDGSFRRFEKVYLLRFASLPCATHPHVLSKFSLLKKCELGSREMDCSKMFTKVTTDGGMCCSFNMKDIFRDSQYSQLLREMQQSDRNGSVEEREDVPKARAGLKSGVRVTLDLHSNFISHGSVHDDYNAFKVFVGQQTEFPLLNQYGVGIQPGYEHFLSVTSSVVSANGIQALPPEDRNCYFSEEGSLQYYRSYTFSNCMFECSIKKAQAELSCSLWYLPHPTGMVICDPWSGFEFSKILARGGGECGECLPDCESVTLDVRHNRAELRDCDALNINQSPLCTINQKRNVEETEYQERVTEWYRDTAIQVCLDNCVTSRLCCPAVRQARDRAEVEDQGSSQPLLSLHRKPHRTRQADLRRREPC